MKKVISVILSTIILVSSVLCVDLSAMANQINITNRAEWLSQLVKTFDMTVESDNYPDNYFSDLSDDSPYYRDILVATEFGIVDIEAGDPVNPEGEVTREFAAQTLNFCLKYVLDKDDDFEYSFADYEQCEYPDDDQIAVDHGWFELDENNNFCPNQAATLDEAEIMIDEAKETIKADEVDEHYESTFEYQKGVVEIDKDSSFEFVDDNNLILYDTSYNIKNGTSFVAYVNEIPVTYTAKNVTKESDCLKIEYVEPENKEGIIKNVDMQAVSQISTEDFVPGKGFEVVDEPQSRLARFKSEKFSVKLKANLPLPAGNSVEFNVTLKNIVLSTKYNTKDDSFEAKLDFDYSFNFSGQFSSVAAVQDALDDFDSIGEIPIAGVGYFSFAPEFDITGSITHSNSYSATIGCSYDAKGLHNITSFKKKSFSITFEGAVKLGLKAEVGVKILIAKVGFYASIGVTAKGTASTNKNAETNTDLYCLSLDAYLYFNLGVDITLGAGFISKDLVFEYEVFNKKNSPIKLGFHLENGKSVPACTADSPNKQKYVTKDSKYGSVTENDGSDIVKSSDFAIESNADGTATVVGYSGKSNYVKIPAYINGYKITRLESTFDAGSIGEPIVSVEIPNTVVEIGQFTFEYCYNLKNVKIPNSVKRIGYRAFYYCSSLNSIVLPDNLSSLGSETFAHSKINTITVPNISLVSGSSFEFTEIETAKISSESKSYSQASGLFYACEVKKIDVDKSNKFYSAIDGVLFNKNKTELIYYPMSKDTKNYSVPSGVKKIRNYAFAGYHCVFSEDGAVYFNGGNEYLENVTLPDSVNEIGSQAFYLCQKLKSVNIGSGVKKIALDSFLACDNLNSINVSENNKTYSSKNGVLFNKNKTSLLNYPLGKTDSSYSVPDTVQIIEANAFGGYGSPMEEDSYIYDKYYGGNFSLKSIIIPDSVTEIKDYAFDNCTNLSDISLSKNIKLFGKEVFNTTKYFKNESNWDNNILYMSNVLVAANSNIEGDLVIRNGITVIADSAFSYKDLKSVIIPNSVINISDSAFYFCSYLTSVTIPESVTNIGDDAFCGCRSLESITIPSSVTNIGNNAFEICRRLTNINVKKSNVNYSSQDGVLFNKNKTELIQYPVGNERTSYNIPNSVINVDEYAFSYCESITNITIPNSVISIGNKAFYECTALKVATLPNSLTNIGDYVFYDCTSLTSVTIPNSVTSIGENGFYSCKSLASVIIPNSVTSIGNHAFSRCESLTNITIPNSVKSIGYSAFSSCSSLTNVTIPNSVKSIGDSVFSHCSSLTNVTIPISVTSIVSFAFYDCLMLKDVYYTGSESEWNSISVGNYNDNLLNATKHYNFVPCTETEHNNYGEWKVIKNATCTEDGLRQRVCSFDNFVQTETLPALGHDFSGNAEYCKHGCGTRNPNYVPPTVTTEPATQPTNTTTVTEPQPTQAPTVVTTTNAPQPTTKAPAPTNSTTVAPAPTEPTTVTTTVAPTTQVEQTATAPQATEPNAVDTTQSTTKVATKPETKTTKAKETVDKKQKKARVKKATPAKASLTITWAKVKGVKGYEIQLATDKKFKKNLKKVTIKKQKTTKTTVKKLKAKTKYYVHIRTYKTKKIKGKNTKVYSSWSKTKTVKTK